MNERNTNRRAQTPGNRTTQRHQIDGRPAPRRQASHASDYSEGSFTQTSRSNTFRTGPRQSAQSSRPRQQQGRRQQPSQRGQQHPSQQRVSGYRTAPTSRRTNRTPIHEQHSYQTLTPRQGTSTYVRHGYSKKRSNLPFFVGGAAALVVVVFLVTTLVGALGGSNQNTQEETLAATDAAPTPTTLTVTFAGDCTWEPMLISAPIPASTLNMKRLTIRLISLPTLPTSSKMTILPW